MNRPSAYQPHLPYIAPALPSNDLLRLVIGFVLIETGYKFGLQAVDALLIAPGLADGYYNGTNRGGLLLQLFSFGLLALAVGFVTHHLHRRPAWTLIGPPQQAWQDLRKVTGAGLMAFLVIEVAPPFYSYAEGAWNAPFLWLTTLPLAMFALLIQTGAEELLYRGYFQQQLAARFRSPLVWMVVPNLFFAAAHWNNAITTNEALDYVTWAFFFGLAASDLTARSGTIGAAIGFHLANNAFAFLFFNEVGGVDSGLALLLFPSSENLLPPSATEAPFPSWRLVQELGVMLIIWLSARIAIKR